MADSDRSSYITRFNFISKAVEYFTGADWYQAASPVGQNGATITAYTPTITGFGTPTSVQFFYKTDGVSVDVWGTFISGIPTAVAAAVSLPVAVFSSHLPTTTTATGIVTVANMQTAYQTSLFYDGSDTANVYMNRSDLNTGGSQITKTNGNSLVNSGVYLSLHFNYPIA